MSVLAPWLTEPETADRVIDFALRKPIQAYDGIGPARVLEPSAGEGALLMALLRHQHGPQPEDMTAIELHRGRAQLLRAAFPQVEVLNRCFVTWAEDLYEDGGPTEPPFELCVMNPPSDDGMDTDHVEAATVVARRVVALVRLAFLTGEGRGRLIFGKCELTGIRFFTGRPSFVDMRSDEERGSSKVADGSPKHDWCIVELERRYGRQVGWTRERFPQDRPDIAWI